MRLSQGRLNSQRKPWTASTQTTHQGMQMCPLNALYAHSLSRSRLSSTPTKVSCPCVSTVPAWSSSGGGALGPQRRSEALPQRLLGPTRLRCSRAPRNVDVPDGAAAEHASSPAGCAVARASKSKPGEGNVSYKKMLLLLFLPKALLQSTSNSCKQNPSRTSELTSTGA